MPSPTPKWPKMGFASKAVNSAKRSPVSPARNWRGKLAGLIPKPTSPSAASPASPASPSAASRARTWRDKLASSAPKWTSPALFPDLPYEGSPPVALRCSVHCGSHVSPVPNMDCFNYSRMEHNRPFAGPRCHIELHGKGKRYIQVPMAHCPQKCRTAMARSVVSKGAQGKGEECVLSDGSRDIYVDPAFCRRHLTRPYAQQSSGCTAKHLTQQGMRTLGLGDATCTALKLRTSVL